MSFDFGLVERLMATEDDVVTSMGVDARPTSDGPPQLPSLPDTIMVSGQVERTAPAGPSPPPSPPPHTAASPLPPKDSVREPRRTKKQRSEDELKLGSKMKRKRREKDMKDGWRAVSVLDFRVYNCAEKNNATAHAKTVYKKRDIYPDRCLLDRVLCNAEGVPCAMRWLTSVGTDETPAAYTYAVLVTSDAKRLPRLVAKSITKTTDGELWQQLVNRFDNRLPSHEGVDAVAKAHGTIVNESLGCIWFDKSTEYCSH